ncbi:MAG: Flp pilus assembly complex ATPase component TadA [Candidatus Omnitrophica bacterium]|nr:Flp pilus assembly complex ATPase component TadA [Candidatus Omnitrophota bacterium]
MQTSVRLGELLVAKKLITQEQLDRAMADQAKTGDRLGKVLLRLGFLQNKLQLKLAISSHTHFSLSEQQMLKPRIDQRLKELVPKDIALEHLILPLERSGKRLKLAIAKAPDIILMDNLRKITDCEVTTVLADEAEIKSAIERFYSTTELEEMVSSSAMDKASDLIIREDTEEKVDLETLAAQADEAPVIRLVDILLKKAADDRASDIHIEPFHNNISIRYRIDGTLYELPPPPKQFHLAVVSRIKILAKIDIAEKRIPQDGSFSLQYQGRKIDIRVSTIPVIHGEKVVMRLLDKRTELLDLTALGFEAEQLSMFEEAIKRPFGLIFLTGPTGSGKSTTLYAAINKRCSSKVNVLTIEDPVEYQIPGINQVQVKPEIGLTFATGLRAFLRQDPDVILVGEVRDQETAEICIRAALTGHLVMSTLHTNDAATAVSRLVDIGVKPFLVSASLILVGAQRLIRILCEHCKVPDQIDAETKKDFGIKAPVIYKAKGCKECRQIGYWGRMAIYELLPVDEKIRHAITNGADIETIRALQKERGYATLRKSGLKKVEAGQTSLEEILSIAYE